MGTWSLLAGYWLLLIFDILIGYHSVKGWDIVLKAISALFGVNVHCLKSYLAVHCIAL